MAKTKLMGNEINTNSDLPKIGDNLENFILTNKKLEDVQLKDFEGKKLVLNIFPSLDTKVCAQSVRKFNEEAAALNDTKVLCISKDLPFAHDRFCAAEGIENVISLSEFRDDNFSSKNGLLLVDSAMKGLMARSVIVLDNNHKIVYTELVKDIVEEPNYEKAIAAAKE